MKKSIGANTIIYPTPVLIIGTYDEKDKPNMAAVAWGGICCSKPPCIAISLRKATYTYGNILKKMAFTVNIPSVKYLKESDYVGIFSGKDENKFVKTGLTPEASDLVNAPYVKEFPFILECKLIHTYEIGLHTQFIGEILDIKAEEEVLGENGMPDIEKVKPFLYAPGNMSYHAVGKYLGKGHTVGKTLLSDE